MATLGLGRATTRSTLQCNVGNQSLVYLCSLCPGNAESLQLNLELEEVDDVVFTVIGDRSIHLSGYYIAKTSFRRAMFDAYSSESYGEDIADTDNERSDSSDEYDFDDSFIDDDPIPKVFSPSPGSIEEEDSDDYKSIGKKNKHGRYRIKYNSEESDDDDGGDGGFVEKQNETKSLPNGHSTKLDKSEEDKPKLDNMTEHILAGQEQNKDGADDEKQNETVDKMMLSLSEDSMLISSLYKNKACQKNSDEEIHKTGDSKAFDAKNKNDEDDGDSIIQTALQADNILQDSQMHREAALSDEKKDVGDVKKSKKQKKEKETKSSPKIDKMSLDILAGHEQIEDSPDDDKQSETADINLPSFEVGHAQDEKPKKKRKEQLKEHIKQPTVYEFELVASYEKNYGKLSELSKSDYDKITRPRQESKTVEKELKYETESFEILQRQSTEEPKSPLREKRKRKEKTTPRLEWHDCDKEDGEANFDAGNFGFFIF
ncbi:hypothetical protein PIB30_056337 [Stylosanthes scabra]|uniref:peptidylprolyl isomerase n=1 Tax=Stylosanthes scabra TaxID=79078 RepID=A0ABU6VLS5_9FABA|nr:hypothetical protein [Stylosanthes scabra]